MRMACATKRKRGSARCLKTLKENGECIVCCLALTPDGRTIFSGSNDCTIRVWDLVSGTCIQKVQAHQDWVRCMKVAADGKHLFSGSKDCTIRVWAINEVSNGKAGVELQSKTRRHKSLTRELHLVRVLKGHKEWVRCFDTPSIDGSRLFSGSDDCTIREWDLVETLKNTSINGRHITEANESAEDEDLDDDVCTRVIACPDWVRTLVVCSNGQSLFCGLQDFSVRKVKIVNGEVEATFVGHTDMITCMKQSRVQSVISKETYVDLLYTGSDDNTVRQWLVSNGTCLRTFSGHTDWIRSIRLSASGDTLFTSSQDKTICIYDTGFHTNKYGCGCEHCRHLKVLESPRKEECFSPYLVLAGHKDAVWDIEVTPDADMLISSSADGTKMLWLVGMPRLWNKETHKYFPEEFKEQVRYMLKLHKHCRSKEPQSPLSYINSQILDNVLGFLAALDNPLRNFCTCPFLTSNKRGKCDYLSLNT